MNDNPIIKSILVGDLYKPKHFLLKNNKLINEVKLKYNKANFVSSYLNSKDLISATLKINKAIPQEDIEDVIEIRAYEELGLDQATDYHIGYIENTPTEKDRVFIIFAAEALVISEKSQELTQHTKYIDLLLPEPLLYRTLYSNEVLSDNNTDIFINFDEDSAILVLYVNGELTYSKKLDYNLNKMYDKHTEIIGELDDKKEFFHFLIEEGLKTTNEKYQGTFSSIFKEIFSNISDIIIYLKRNYEIEKVNNLFLGSSRGLIKGLESYGDSFLGIRIQPLEFKTSIESDEWHMDQNKMLLALSSVDYLEGKSDEINLTVIERPPSFAKRSSGQFIIALGFSIMIASSYPLYFLVGSYVNDSATYALKKKEDSLNKEQIRYKVLINKARKVNNDFKDTLKKKTTIFNDKKENLTSIYNKKVNYNMKSERLAKIAMKLKEYKLTVDTIQFDKNLYKVSIVSESDIDITNFIQHISKIEFKNLKSIDIRNISKNEGEIYYTGILEVQFNENN